MESSSEEEEPPFKRARTDHDAGDANGPTSAEEAVMILQSCVPSLSDDMQTWLAGDPSSTNPWSNMDSLLPLLLAFPPHPPPATPLSDKDYDMQIRSVLQLLNKTSAKKLTGGVSGGGDLLEIIDPSINTLPYLYVLVAHVNSSQGGKQLPNEPNKALLPGGRLWDPLLNFMARFDPVQIRYGGPELAQLISAVEYSARLASMPAIAIEPIKLAIMRIDPSGSCFTSTHLSFARLCLEAREFEAAKPVLDNDVYAFPCTEEIPAYTAAHPYLCSHHDSSSYFITSSSGLTEKLTYKDYLLYFLFGGMIYTGLKDWERALHFYELAIISPVAQKVSMIQVEAYKKRVLVGILACGGPLPMPKTTSTHAAKIYRSLTKAYELVAEIFQESLINETNQSRLVAEANEGQQIWLDDSNHGLMKQVVAAFRRFSVLKIGEVYATMRIADVAQRTSPNPADFLGTADYVKGLIAAGELKGKVTEAGDDPGTWVLEFFDEADEEPSEAEMETHLLQTKLHVDTVRERVSEANRRLGLTREYLDWKKKNEGQKGSAGSGLDQIPDEFMAIDEDMMVDT